MNSTETKQRYGLYRQGLDNSPPADKDFEALLPLYLEIRRILIYTGLIRPDNIAASEELASVRVSGKFYPVPGLWTAAGLGAAPGTVVYYDPAAEALTTTPAIYANTAFVAGIVDVNNNVVCTGIRHIPVSL